PSASSVCFCLSSSAAHRALPSFPTRRSSDLCGRASELKIDGVSPARAAQLESAIGGAIPLKPVVLNATSRTLLTAYSGAGFNHRSEEHTSELQSLTNLVCRLLLEKKKKHTSHTTSVMKLLQALPVKNGQAALQYSRAPTTQQRSAHARYHPALRYRPSDSSQPPTAV